MIDAIIIKLQNAQLNGEPLFVFVKDAIDLAVAMKSAVQQSPVAYVFEISRRPGSNERDMGPVCQRIVTTVGVVIGVSKRNDKTGSKAKANISPILAQTRKTLFGFIPTTEHSELLFGAADTVGVTDNALWQLERFTTEHYEESTNV